MVMQQHEGLQRQVATWYLVQCKPRQDERAEENLVRQGYQCFRPLLSCERIVQGRRRAVVESLFPGYLFIALCSDANWAPLRSTRGVSRLVAFNGAPLPVAEKLIESLRQRATANDALPLVAGDMVRINQGCFAELEGVFDSCVGDERVVLLLTLLKQQHRIELPLGSICKM